jgi:hypothetical protein
MSYPVIAAVALAGCQSTPTKKVTETESESMPEIQYSDQVFLDLVEKYGDEEGKVDYQAWKDDAEDMRRMDDQVALVAAVSPKSHPGQFAVPGAARGYWINAYNMLVVDAVLEYWPLESVRDVKISVTSRLVPGKGFFYDRKVVVGGEETNLWDLEKEVLRSQKDPRLHFAFNCASSSCPVLRPWEWTDEQLDTAARDFVNDPANVAVRDDAIYLSRIFKWYRKDFPEDQVEYVIQFAKPDLASSLREATAQGLPTRFFEYDWEVNDTEPGDES